MRYAAWMESGTPLVATGQQILGVTGRLRRTRRQHPIELLIVLLDDDFGSIVEAVRLGRRIYDNLKKSMEIGRAHV